MTKAEKCRRHIIEEGSCDLCGHPWETTIHAIRDCVFASGVWRSLVRMEHWGDFFSLDGANWIEANLQGGNWSAFDWAP